MRTTRVQLEPCDALALGEEPVARDAEIEAVLERAAEAAEFRRPRRARMTAETPDYCKITRQVVGEGI